MIGSAPLCEKDTNLDDSQPLRQSSTVPNCCDVTVLMHVAKNHRSQTLIATRQTAHPQPRQVIDSVAVRRRCLRLGAYSAAIPSCCFPPASLTNDTAAGTGSLIVGESPVLSILSHIFHFDFGSSTFPLTIPFMAPGASVVNADRTCSRAEARR